MVINNAQYKIISETWSKIREIKIDNITTRSLLQNLTNPSLE